MLQIFMPLIVRGSEAIRAQFRRITASARLLPSLSLDLLVDRPSPNFAIALYIHTRGDVLSCLYGHTSI